jgi:hypothetical protein
MLFRSLVVVGFTIPFAAAQAQEDTLQTLLKEVHALRVAMERSNQIAPKVQIALARMQLQEERTRNANRQLQDVRNQITDVQNKMSEIADAAKRVEARQAQSTDPNERKQMDLELAAQKAELGQLSAQEQQFRAKEAEASSLVLSEQAKWNEVNDLLTSIERVLLASQP